MVMIDFVKLTDTLLGLDILKISIVGFIFFSLIMGILADIIDQKDLGEDLGVISVLILIMLAVFFGTSYIGINYYYPGMKKTLEKAKVTNIKNLKRNRKIVEDAIKYNGAVKSKEEYINTLLNKFYLDGKDATPDEKELMKKLKK